ncbi:hypothetical protein BYT27DRAFT_6799290 [Phlegmacium glaucopus]|nr:hypothetical protein BYT27DRAFT_6799290 [Phlegmacium glaucopus]
MPMAERYSHCARMKAKPNIRREVRKNRERLGHKVLTWAISESVWEGQTRGHPGLISRDYLTNPPPLTQSQL